MSQEQDRGAVPRRSTINTYAGYADSMLRHKKRQVCVYDGPETGSTGLLRMKEITDKERSTHRETYVTLSKTINANENFAPEAFTSLDMSMDRELLAA